MLYTRFAVVGGGKLGRPKDFCRVSSIERRPLRLKAGLDNELWLGGVASVGDVDIDKYREGKVGGDVLVRWEEIVFDTGWSG